MSETTSKRLIRKSAEILQKWEKRVNEEIKAAGHQETIALRNSLPVYLAQLSDALSAPSDSKNARKRISLEASTRIGKEHGKDRAYSLNYTIDQLIFEYHILRQVICEVLEEDEVLAPLDREVIVCSIEQAVNDAATQFSDSLKDFQEHLSHTLAHDLRNPVTTAKACAELILKQPENKDRSADMAKRILKSTDRIEKMITEILDASRNRAGKTFELEFKECDLNLLVREIADDFNLNNHNQLKVESSGPCVGFWNEDGLRRIIENVVVNAFKYGMENTPVTIVLKQDEKTATLSIHNEGKAIPHEEQKILFEKFRRSESSENKVGWGLGLTVTREMVDAHKGSIKVESEPGKGTTFIINVPKGSEKNAEIGKTSEENIKMRKSDPTYNVLKGDQRDSQSHHQ